MTIAASPQRRRKKGDLAVARTRLIGVLCQAMGPEMTEERAQEMLERSRVWDRVAAHRVDEHLVEHPDAFTSPSLHCPRSLARLLVLLVEAGFDEKVVLLGCARCGRTEVPLTRPSPEGRCCERCVVGTEHGVCARCGRSGSLKARRDEGAICRRCYESEPERKVACARCGRVAVAVRREDDGSVLCRACYRTPKKPCSHCGREARAAAITAKGPVCRSCYRSPERLCGICGRMAALTVRGDESGRGNVCTKCYRNLGECVVCGRRAHGGHYRGGPFTCTHCWPRPARTCAICLRQKRIHAKWPLGDVCGACWHARLNHPAPCIDCGEVAILVCRSELGEVCSRCGGADLNFSCRTCGRQGPGFYDGQCRRCWVRTSIHRLLAAEDGTIAAHLQPFADALAAANPVTVRGWLHSSRSAELLAELVAAQTPITHDALDRFLPARHINHVRALLVATGVLPRRNEALARLEFWVGHHVPTLPPHQQSIIRPYAEWHILRRARRQATRSTYSENASRAARRRIRAAIEFLNWSDRHGIALAELTQHHIDTFVTTKVNPEHCLLFIDWLERRRLITGIEVVHRTHGPPQRFLGHEELESQLRRCLHDPSLPLDVRIAGALVRLYALPLARIVELTTDRFRRDSAHAYLVIDTNPVVLPPALADLIEERIRKGAINSMVRSISADLPAYLLPGRPPSRPRNVQSLYKLLARHELPTIAARNTAMMTNIGDLNPTLVSDLFGISRSTAHAWARFAQASWATYLAAAGAQHDGGRR